MADAERRLARSLARRLANANSEKWRRPLAAAAVRCKIPARAAPCGASEQASMPAACAANSTTYLNFLVLFPVVSTSAIWIPPFCILGCGITAQTCSARLRFAIRYCIRDPQAFVRFLRTCILHYLCTLFWHFMHFLSQSHFDYHDLFTRLCMRFSGFERLRLRSAVASALLYNHFVAGFSFELSFISFYAGINTLSFCISVSTHFTSRHSRLHLCCIFWITQRLVESHRCHAACRAIHYTASGVFVYHCFLSPLAHFSHTLFIRPLVFCFVLLGCDFLGATATTSLRSFCAPKCVFCFTFLRLEPFCIFLSNHLFVRAW